MQKQEKMLYGGLTVYRERGLYLHQLEQYEKAKAAYDVASSFAPDDMRLLLARSRTCAYAVQPGPAFADADLALKLDPANVVAQNTQARALFTMSEFERSIVMNHRGARRRVQPTCFTDGINQCRQNIQDAVGENVRYLLLDRLPLIEKHQDQQIDDDEPEIRKHVSRIPRSETKQKFTQKETKNRAILSHTLAIKYLGPMAYEKFFLQEILGDPNIKSANTVGSEKLEGVITEAIEALSYKQDMLRRQQPYYAVQLAERTASKRQNKYLEEVFEKERKIAKTNAKQMLKAIEACLHSNKIMDLVAKAERFQRYLDTKTSRTLPGKGLYVDHLYHYVGQGYLSQYRLSTRLSDRANRRRLAFLMGLPTERPTSYDPVLANYPYQYLDMKVVKNKLLENLEICENSTMKCWLMYELARILCTQKHYALAKYYGKQCQKEAKDVGNPTWWMNGCLMILSSDMQQGNVNDVKLTIEEASEWTKKLDNREAIETFLVKCSSMVNEPVEVDERKAIQLRQNQILKLMCDDNVRVDTEQLFKRIAIVPKGRRFCVLPNKRAFDLHRVERSRYRQPGLTIISPSHRTHLRRPPQSGVLGLQLFDL